MSNNKPPFMGERARLGDLLTKARSKRCGDSSYPVLSMTMHDGIVRQDDRFKKSIASRDTKSYKVVMPGQLVVGFPIDEGVIYIQKLQQPGIMSPAYQVWDVDESRVRPRYLELALHSPRSMAYYAAKMRGTTARRRSITADNLCALEIPVPSLERQDGIVAAFEHVGSLLAFCEQVSGCLDSLVKSQFVEMFGTANERLCEYVSLEDICSAIVGCPHETPKYNGDLQHPAIRTSELVGTTINWETMKYVSHEEYLRRTKRLAPLPGDVVYAREGTYGNAAVLPEGHEFCLGQRTMLFRPDGNICSPVYFLYALTSTDVRRQADELNVGSTVPHINVRDAKRFLIPLPSIELQSEFAFIVYEVDKSRFVVQQQIEKLQMLYDSLAQEYFG